MTVDDPAQTPREWRPRLEALSEAQSRYFYVLGGAGVLFLALLAGLEGGDQEILGPDWVRQMRTTGVFSFQVSTALVLATGPTVLGFLVQAVTGTILATDTAAWRMAVLEGVEFEREHTSPSAIDLAFYTSDRSPALFRAGSLLVYPAYLTVFLLEGFWLALWLGDAEASAFPGADAVKWLLLVLGFTLLIAALPRLLSLWWRKLSHAWVLLRHRNTPVWRARAVVALADITDSLRGAGRKVESRAEGRTYRLLVDDQEVASGRSLQELTVRTREWVERQTAEE